MFENVFIISTTGALNSGMMTSTTWMYDKVVHGPQRRLDYRVSLYVIKQHYDLHVVYM